MSREYESIVSETISDSTRRRDYRALQDKYVKALYELFEYYLYHQYNRTIVPWELRTSKFRDAWFQSFRNMIGAATIRLPYNQGWFWHWRTASLDLKDVDDQADATLKEFHRNYAPLAEKNDFTWVKSLSRERHDSE